MGEKHALSLAAQCRNWREFRTAPARSELHHLESGRINRGLIPDWPKKRSTGPLPAKPTIRQIERQTRRFPEQTIRAFRSAPCRSSERTVTIRAGTVPTCEDIRIVICGPVPADFQVECEWSSTHPVDKNSAVTEQKRAISGMRREGPGPPGRELVLAVQMMLLVGLCWKGARQVPVFRATCSSQGNLGGGSVPLTVPRVRHSS